MDNWKKIMSFDNPYEAEIRKQLLQNANIQSVVINARDSLFLIGNVDLYVQKENDKKALIILEQFQGLTKVNSFIMKEPIIRFQQTLEKAGISTVLKEKSNEKYILENYELYVKNEDASKAIPFVTGEKLEGWKLLKTCKKVRQTQYRIELLNEHNIESLITKKRNSDFHLEDISIYVKEDDFNKSNSIITKLEGWVKIRTFKKIENIELKEDIFATKGVRGIIISDNNEFGLFVKNEQKENAENIAKATKEWAEIRRFNTHIEAENTLYILTENNIEGSILTIKDSMFLIGGYSVYIEKRKIQEAIEILTEAEGGKITE